MVKTGYRELIVMRHAKTEQQAGNDAERQLTERGEADARAAGRWLAEQGIAPDVVLTSPAARARATAELVAAELADSPAVDVVDSLYGASAEEVLEVLAAVSDDRRSVLLVGHNPTMEELGHLLAGDGSVAAASHLPTAGIVVLAIAAEWSRITAHAAELVQQHVARD